MDAAKWPQYSPEIGLVKPMEEVASNTCNSRQMLERKARPQEQLNCPRCNSTNTKFCYYNNYSLYQPRYFCKTCRRYWTEGGSLRNVPVGGGSRKNKRSLSSSSTSSAPSKLPDLNPPSLAQFSSQNPKTHKGQDLNLAFQVMHESSHDHMPQYIGMTKTESNNNNNRNSNQQNSSISSSYNSSSLSALDLLRTGIASRGLDSFIPTPMPDTNTNTLFSSGVPLQDIKPTLSFSIDGLGDRFGNVHGVQENGTAGRLFFPFGELKQIPSSTEVDQNKGQGNSTGYWTGMLGGGSW